MTHCALVEAAAAWLRKTCAVVITEIATVGEEPDAIGWNGVNSVLIECKASRADFLSDRRKYFRREPERGIGCRRFFLMPAGLVASTEIPTGWGLLESDGRRVRQVIHSEPFREMDSRHEIRILLSALRRIGSTAPPGISIRHYTIESENRATLGTLAEGAPVPAPETPRHALLTGRPGEDRSGGQDAPAGRKETLG